MPSGDTLRLSANVAQANCSGLTVTWTSSNAAVASVSPAGTVTGVSVGGPVTITGTAAGVSGSTSITVTPAPIATIALTIASTTIAEGQVEQVTAAVRDARGNALTGRALQWATSNAAVASVDASGRVTGTGGGTANITSSDASNPSVSGTLAITVTAGTVASIAFDAPPSTYTVGLGTPLSVTVKDAAGRVLNNRAVRWSSSDASLALVPPATWTACANEGGTCTFVGTKLVRYGANGRFLVKQATTSLACNTTAFGTDPLPNVLKSCSMGDLTVTTDGKAVMRGIGVAGLVPPVLTATSVDVPSVSAQISPQSAAGGVYRDILLIRTAAVTGNPFIVNMQRYDSAGFNVRPISFIQFATDILGPGSGLFNDYNWGLDALAVGTATVVVGPGSGVTGPTDSISVTVDPPTVAVSTIAVSTASASVAVGQTTALTSVLRDAGGNVLTRRLVRWSISDSSVVFVQRLGPNMVVRGRAPGTAVVTGTSEGKSATVTVTVPVPAGASVASVAVTANSTSLTVPQTTQASAILRDAQNNVLTGRTITWASSNSAIASVSSTGFVQSVAAGTASITATSEGITGSVSITVAAGAAPVASVAVSLLEGRLFTGQATTATETLTDAAGNVLSGRTVVWTSSAPSIASVGATGAVTAIAPGTATITATSEGKSGAATLTVDPPIALASRLAYAFVNGSTATLNQSFTNNVSGGAVVVTRRATGRWLVDFGKMGRGPNQSETVLVTPADQSHCTVEGWSTNGESITVAVRCYAIPGFAPTDADFTVLVVGNASLTGRSAFVSANLETSNSYTPEVGLSYNSNAASMSLARTATGTYTATLGIFPRPGGNGGPPEVPLMSTVSSAGTTVQCQSNGVDVTGGSLAFQDCRNTSNALADAKYNLLIVSGGRAAAAWGFAYIDANPANAGILPFFQKQSTGNAVTFTNTAFRKTVSMDPVPVGQSRGVFVMPNFNNVWVSCGLGTLNPTAGTYGVTCRNAAGTIVESTFTIVVIQ